MMQDSNIIKTTPPAKPYRLVIMIVFAVLIAGGGFYAVHHHLTKASSPKSANASYSKLVQYTLHSQTVASDFHFSAPAEFQTPPPVAPPPANAKAPSSTLPNQIVLKQMATADKNTLPVGGAEASSSTLSETGAAHQTAILNNPKDPDYTSTAAAIEKSAADRLGEFKVSFSSLSPFKNANIKANAWQIDFTGTASVPSAKSTSNLKGKLVYIIGKTTGYSFLTYASDSNWQNNQNAWQKVLNSLKIDQ